jgi:DNA-binding Lrp family transcriptional regulator
MELENTFLHRKTSTLNFVSDLVHEEKIGVTFITNLYRASERRFNLIHAFILAKVEAGKDEEVLKEVKMMTGVQHATPTYGLYDLYVDVSFRDKDELDRFIFDRIRRIAGIKETVTLLAFTRYET